MRLSCSRLLPCLLAAVTTYSCGQETREGAPPVSTANLNATTRPPVGVEKSAPPPSSEVVASRGRLLGWLPRSSLLAVRVPALQGLGAAMAQTAAGQALGRMDLAACLGTLEGVFQEFNVEVERILPGAARLTSILEGLEGEVVFGVVHAYPMLMMGGKSTLPFTAVLYVELRKDTESMRQFLAELIQRLNGEAISSHEFRLDRTGVRFEALVHEQSLAVRVGPSQILEPALLEWIQQPAAESMLSSRIVAEAPRLQGSNIRVWTEVFVNLRPLWDLVGGLAPARVKEPLQALGLTGLEGVSLVSALAGAGFHEAVTVHSQGRSDALTGMCSVDGVDPAWLRFVPGDSESAAVLRFDPGAAFDRTLAMLPTPMKESVRGGIQDLRDQTQVDVEIDILRNFGPHFVVAGTGSPYGEGQRPFEVSMTLQVKNSTRARQFLNMILQQSGLSRVRQAHRLGNETYYSIDLPNASFAGALPFPLKVSYAIGEDYLLVASTPSALQKALVAAQANGRLAPVPLRRLTEGKSDAFFMTFQSVESQVRGLVGIAHDLQASMPALASWPIPTMDEAGRLAATLPNTLSWARALPEGVRLESQAAVSTVLMGGMAMGAGMVASVAIPSLLGARTDANERTAAETLRKIASAQMEFRERAVIDRDGDGIGEFAYLGELNGLIAPSGSGEPLSSAFLPAEFQTMRSGCLEKHGYFFRVDLPGSGGTWHSEAQEGGRTRTLAADPTERAFLAYAWPVEVDTTGRRVFVIDETGKVHANDNETQGYSGLENQPASTAALSSSPFTRGTGRSVRRGGDGSLWLREDI